MKALRIFAAGVATCMTSATALASDMDDVLKRLTALEKENAAIRKENGALLENIQLRERNAQLKASSQLRHAAPKAASVAAGEVPRHSDQVRSGTTLSTVAATPAMQKEEETGAGFFSLFSLFQGNSIKQKQKGPMDAYAADMPVKALPVTDRGQFRIWGEGGAFWSGGDRVSQDYLLLGGLVAGGAGTFDLNPKVGWEGAAGFDYRFADSPWHVSGQVRYGQSGKASGAASGAVDFTQTFNNIGIILGNNNNPSTVTSAFANETITADYRETHWLADLAVGRDVLGSGPSSMQLKGGMRIAQLIGNLNSNDTQNLSVAFTPAQPVGGVNISSFSVSSLANTATRTSFLGIGPRIGVEGSVPLASKWTFDYLGDAAFLFGTDKTVTTNTTNFAISPPILATLGAFGGGGFFGGLAGSNTTTTAQFAGIFNGDIQVGVSYWINPNLKVSGSYRLDAFIHAFNESGQAINNQTPDRFIHGPRLAVTGQF